MEDLYNYMIWGDYNKRIEELANLALPEKALQTIKFEGSYSL